MAISSVPRFRFSPQPPILLGNPLHPTPLRFLCRMLLGFFFGCLFVLWLGTAILLFCWNAKDIWCNDAWRQPPLCLYMCVCVWGISSKRSCVLFRRSTPESPARFVWVHLSSTLGSRSSIPVPLRQPNQPILLQSSAAAAAFIILLAYPCPDSCGRLEKPSPRRREKKVTGLGCWDKESRIKPRRWRGWLKGQEETQSVGRKK